MGETAMRLGRVMLRKEMGENKLLIAIGFAALSFDPRVDETAPSPYDSGENPF
jgi:hypothetical protein